MNVCLISAPTASQLYDRAVDETTAARIMGELAPVGILSLAAVLEANGLQPEVVDLNRVYYDFRQQSDPNEIAFCRFAGSYFASRASDFFGFSTVCSSYPLTLRVAAEVKRLHPESVVALGGPQASVVDVATMQAYPFIDFVVRGEAEHVLSDLLDALAGRGRLEAIAGVTFRENGRIVRNQDASPVSDLDTLPFPAFKLFPDIRFCRHFPLELGRGCPFACTFCSTNDFFRRRFRLKSPERMIADMRRVRDEYGINSFELVHDMFTVDRKRVVDFCEALLESKEDFHWGCSARTDCVDEDLIALMARAGCRGIFFGIETGSSRMQKVIDKGLELNDSAKRVRSCDKFKINTAVSLMAGFPEETMSDLRATAAFFVDSLRSDHADPQLSILAPLSNTPIQRQHKESLTLDDDIADMSYRGWPQEREDHAMIADHPEIFSSFYSVPTPHIEHDFLKELRDFLLTGMRAFRWLLLGLHQDSGDVTGLFSEWRKWRAENCESFPGGNRTVYYSHGSFRSDFLSFVRLHYVPFMSKSPVAITALLDYEAGLLGVDYESDEEPAADCVREPVAGDTDEMMSPDSRPRLLPGVTVIKVAADYHEIVRRLRQGSPLHDVNDRPVNLAIRRTSTGATEIRQLSPLSSRLLGLCEGGLTVAEIATDFRQNQIEVAGVPADKLCLAGLEVLRQQHLVGLA